MFLHHHRTLLPPDALGRVICLDVGGHSVLHGAGDVLLDDVGTVVSEKEKNQDLRFPDCLQQQLGPGTSAASFKMQQNRKKEDTSRGT